MKRSLGAALLLAGALDAAAQTPAGPDFLVTPTTATIRDPVGAAMDRQGNFVVAWNDYGRDGNAGGIFARLFDVGGAPLGPDFLVNSETTGYQYGSAVARAPLGDFAVGWSSRTRVFDAAGQPQGPDITLGRRGGLGPALAFDGRDNLIAVWYEERSLRHPGTDVHMQRFDHHGQALGPEFEVNDHRDDYDFARFPKVAAAGDGTFVVVWSQYTYLDAGNRMQGQRFDGHGARLGAEFTVHETTGDEREGLSGLAMNGAHEFIVMWGDRDFEPSTLSARWFNAAGDGGLEFTVVGPVPGVERVGGRAAADASGRFTLAWTSGVAPNPSKVEARRVGPGGAPLSETFRVDATPGTLDKAVELASDPSGNLVFVWSAADGVRARRFGVVQPTALQVDATAGPTADGNGIWEPGEAVALCPSWINRSGISRTVGGQLSELVGPSAASYTIPDPTASYGAVPDGSNAACGDTYTVSVAAPSTRPVTHWDASVIETLTPDTLGPRSRWLLHVGGSFVDVPHSSPYYRFVETLLHRRVTAGCNADHFCPQAVVARQQMAVFALTSREGEGYAPPACISPPFDDVSEASAYCPWIAEMARRGVMGGCGVGIFCPEAPVTRDQMAVILLRTLDPTLDPPACTTPVFADVPAGSAYCRWIEELARRGITGGCGNGNYCPTTPVTREQMSVFLTATFGLTLYGP